jgi:hypothetical protein
MLAWLLDHPFDHPDDPIGPVRIRLDRRGIPPEPAQIGLEPTRSTLSTRLRIWRSGGMLAGAAHCGPFRSDMAAVVHGSAAGCPVRLLPQCPHALPRSPVSAVPRRACSRASGRPRPVSTRPDSRCPAGCVRTAGIRRPRGPGLLTSADEQAQPARRCRRAGTAAAGPPPSCRSRPGRRTPLPVSGWLRNRTPPDAVAVRCRFRNRGRCPDGWSVSIADTAAACGCPRLVSWS